MEILLWRTVDKLGERGEVVDVAPGYARNYLFRKGWATPNTEENEQRLEQEAERLRREEQQRINEHQELLNELEELFLVLKVECNEEGQLYGSVTSKVVADEIQQKHGLDVDSRQVELKQPIQHLGVYTIPLRLHPEVQGSMNAWVVERTEEDEE
jgi:large subunit ribosomal protein L9